MGAVYNAVVADYQARYVGGDWGDKSSYSSQVGWMPSGPDFVKYDPDQTGVAQQWGNGFARFLYLHQNDTITKQVEAVGNDNTLLDRLGPGIVLLPFAIGAGLEAIGYGTATSATTATAADAGSTGWVSAEGGTGYAGGAADFSSGSLSDWAASADEYANETAKFAAQNAAEPGSLLTTGGASGGLDLTSWASKDLLTVAKSAAGAVTAIRQATGRAGTPTGVYTMQPGYQQQGASAPGGSGMWWLLGGLAAALILGG
jgi:hypothetical protein